MPFPRVFGDAHRSHGLATKSAETAHLAVVPYREISEGTHSSHCADRYFPFPSIESESSKPIIFIDEGPKTLI